MQRDSQVKSLWVGLQGQKHVLEAEGAGSTNMLELGKELMG